MFEPKLTTLLLFLLLSAGGAAQELRRPSPPPPVATAPNRLSEIRVSGSQRFQTAQVIKATGLRVGEGVDETAMKAAADRLVSTGMFSDVAYEYFVTPQGVRLDFRVTETNKLLPAHFDNFVWLSPAELTKQLQDFEPLFVGEVPNAGEMSQRIADDVQKILAGLNVAAQVRVFPQSPPGGGDVVGFLYQVEGVKISIRSIEFAGVSAELRDVLQNAASGLMGKDYSENAVRAVARLDFLPQYRMRGYLRAEFGAPVASLRDHAAGDVAVRLPVSEGFSYALAAVLWSGNANFSDGELAKGLKVQVGRPANQVQLEDDLGGISKMCGTRGYIDARMEPRFSFDDAAHTVTVHVNVREGDQYRMGKLRFEGLSQSAAESLRKIWKLREGDVYDASYLGAFFVAAGREFSLRDLKIETVSQPRRESRTIDLVLRFEPK